jgi:hypothetical protein
MRRKFALLLLLLPVATCAWPQSAAIPDTAAGHTPQAWLDAFNSADRIGETTGGGAHPVSGHRIDDHFMIGVPFARAVKVICKTNWEGTGVHPDVKVPADQALGVAKKMAAEQINNGQAKKK